MTVPGNFSGGGVEIDNHTQPQQSQQQPNLQQALQVVYVSNEFVYKLSGPTTTDPLSSTSN